MKDVLSPPSGVSILHNPHLNRGSAFTAEQRRALHIEGLLPPVAIRRAVTGDRQRRKSVSQDAVI